MTNTRKAELFDRIARLNGRIVEVKYEITRWQDELDDLEVERADLFEELDEAHPSRSRAP